MNELTLTHGAFKRIDPNQLDQYHLFCITGQTELPIGSEMYVARGFADYDDCYDVHCNYLHNSTMTINPHECKQQFWDIFTYTNFYCDDVNDEWAVYCMGGEL